MKDNLSNNTVIDIILCQSYMNEGLPILQSYLTNNIYTGDMNGFYIPEINFSYNNNIIKNNTTTIIKPIKNGKYDTTTYSNLDLVYKFLFHE